MHLSNLRSMVRLSPRSLKITEFGTPKSIDAYKSISSNIRTPHDEDKDKDRKPSVDYDTTVVREGINKENSGPSPLNCKNPFFVGSTAQSAALFSPSCPSLQSSNQTPPIVATTALPPTPLFLPATVSPTLRSISPSHKRRPRPLVLNPLETSSPSQPLPRSPLITPEARKSVPQRVSLSPTTARFMMLEAMVQEATSATAEAYAASRKHSAPSSSSTRNRLPIFSASNPFGRVPKATVPAPSSSSSSSASSSVSSSSLVVTSTPAEDTDYPLKESKIEFQKTGYTSEKKIRRESKVRDNQESDSTHDSITGLPDMQLVRDHNQSKSPTESPYNNCQGVLEKVSVLLKLFQTHTDDVPSEREETSSLFVMPEMTPAYVSMSRRSNTPIEHSNQSTAGTKDTISPLTVIFPDVDRGVRGVSGSGVIALTDDIYQESNPTDPILAAKTPMRNNKASNFSPDLPTKLAECSLRRSPREHSLSSKDYFSSPETRECPTRSNSSDQISPLSDGSHLIQEGKLGNLSPLELPMLGMKLDANSVATSPVSGTSYTPTGHPTTTPPTTAATAITTVTESAKRLSIMSARSNRMFSASRGRGDSFKTPPPVSKSDYNVSRSDVDRLKGLLCVSLNTDLGSDDRIESTEGEGEGEGADEEEGCEGEGGGRERGRERGSSICRSPSTHSPGSMSACRAAVSRVIAPSATRRGGIVGWVGSTESISDRDTDRDRDSTGCAKSLILVESNTNSSTPSSDSGKVQKEGRMRRFIGSRDGYSNDVSPISTTPTGVEEDIDGKVRTGFNRTYTVGLNSAAFESSSEIMRTYTVEAIMSNIETAEEAEKRAAYRLDVRTQIAKWKYNWELASYQAAKVARLLSTESF